MEQKEQKDIIFCNAIGEIGTNVEVEYLAHLLCLGDRCSFVFNEKTFELQSGDLSIVRRRSLIEKIFPSDDFKCKIIYAKPAFIELSTPQSNYAIKGQISLFNNPVIHLTPVQQELCLRDFDILEQRIKNSNHCFYQETLTNAMQTAILDFFDFHARVYEKEATSTGNASIMNSFLSILEEGTYRKHREVSFYADRLCITSKYLSEVSKNVSGFSANYWINRYTSLDISRQLRNKTLTIACISDMFNFSSPAYFSRYVQRNLGIKPSDYR